MKFYFFGATDTVTGSCHKLEVADKSGTVHNILIDCGMFQGERICGSRNLPKFDFDPKTIEAVFVTHTHADHIGRLPKLIKEGFSGVIYMTPPTRALAKIVLEDTQHIMAENSEKCGDPILFSLADVEMVFTKTEIVNYHEAVELGPDLIVMFHDVAHILGSSYISVEAENKRIIFSGDIGNDNVPILPTTESLSSADVVICEATYGGRTHEPVSERQELLEDAMRLVYQRKSTLLIPAFSIERTQEVLYAMNNILHRFNWEMPIFLDSPMAIRATAVYREYANYLKFDKDILLEPDRDFFSFPNLHETLSSAASRQINDMPGLKIIIAGSGMMTGGRIMHHLMRYLSSPKNILLVVGYQAEGTLGRQILSGAKNVNIFGNHIPVHIEIRKIGAFSAHADQAKILRWLMPETGTAPKKVFLVHGDDDQKAELSKAIVEVLKSEVIQPVAGQVYEL